MNLEYLYLILYYVYNNKNNNNIVLIIINYSSDIIYIHIYKDIFIH